MKLVVGADHAGFVLKEAIKAHVAAAGHEFVDVGTHEAVSVDYPDFAHALAGALAEKTATLGILVCGSGVGMSIAANRHAHVRAVVCSEPFSARMSRAHNDANVLCLGARVVGEGLAFDVVDAFLGASFEGGRHANRVAKINP
ncbi:MAG: ribose 5-phosphate isomerase B [Polyangiales bacterium]